MHQRDGVLGPCALHRMEAQGRRCEGAVAQKRKALAEAVHQQHSLAQILYYAEKQEASKHRYHAKRLKTLQTLTEVELRVAACLSLITDHIRDDIVRDYCEFVWSAKDRSSAPSTALNWAETHSIIDAEVSIMKACRPVRQGDPDWPHHFAAAKWLAEKLVFEWLVQCNFKGVAPSTTQVVEQYIVCWPEASLGQVAEKHFADRCTAFRCQEWWARSFRKRWLFTYRKLPTQPPQNEDQLREKAGSERTCGPFCFERASHAVSKMSPHGQRSAVHFSSCLVVKVQF